MEKTVVQKYVEPLVDSECKRQNIPRGFISSVHDCYSKPFQAGFCNPKIENGKAVSVDIGIGSGESPIGAIKIFFHEMKHAKQFLRDFEDAMSNPIYCELEANCYELKRTLEIGIGYVGRRLKNFGKKIVQR